MTFEELLIVIPFYALEIGGYVKDCLWSATLLALNRRLLTEHAHLRRELVSYADCIADLAERAEELWEQQVEIVERYLSQPLDLGLTNYRDERVPVFFLPRPESLAPRWIPPPGGIHPRLVPADHGLAPPLEAPGDREGAGSSSASSSSHSP